jgi:signal transduction histidine kinase
MKTTSQLLLFKALLLLLAMTFVHGAVGLNAQGMNEPTKDEVKAFVEKALDFARTHPKDEALKAFTSKNGPFQQGSLYIFAYDFSGQVIAHGGDTSLVGKNLMGMKDPKGVPVIRELAKLANGGEGWLYYTWANPEHGGRQEPKLGYVMKVDDTWFIGSGTYGAPALR